MRYRVVFWDLDGTLIDSMPAHVRAWTIILGEIGIELDPLYLQLHEGEKAEDTVGRLAREHRLTLTRDELSELIRRKRELYRQFAPRGLIPEARATIEELRRGGVECNVVTGSIRSNMNGVVTPEELSFFAHIVAADDYAQGKPAPDPYVRAIDMSGHRVAECLAVENAPLGIRSAQAAGLYTVAITTTLPRERLAEADRVIDQYSELLTFFR